MNYFRWGAQTCRMEHKAHGSRCLAYPGGGDEFIPIIDSRTSGAKKKKIYSGWDEQLGKFHLQARIYIFILRIVIYSKKFTWTLEELSMT